MPVTDVIKLIAAAGHCETDLREKIEAVDPSLTAALVSRELVYRARLNSLRLRLGSPISVIFDFSFRGRSYISAVEVGPEGIRFCPEPADCSSVTVIAQELTEVVGSVYGPREYVSSVSQVVHWPQAAVLASGGRPSVLDPSAYYPLVQRLLRALARGESADLAELAAECGTDKWSALHRYPEHYERHIGPLRDRRLTVLDIGVGGFGDPNLGAESLRMWKHYLPRAVVYGLDIEDKSRFDEDRIVTLRGDQSDPASLVAMATEVGPFDIVIDDGSHISADTLASFRVLFDHVRPNGLYVIEDLQTSYWKPMFEGDDRDLADPRYTVGFLKTLLDGLHYEEFLRADARESRPTDRYIRGIHFYHNVCFLQKGANEEGSPFADLLRRRSGDVAR
jgi:8-demethyl-8-alpha-L-rhamnosyltetracenomycin-C 2'-O-methyltransferase